MYQFTSRALYFSSEACRRNKMDLDQVPHLWRNKTVELNMRTQRSWSRSLLLTCHPHRKQGIRRSADFGYYVVVDFEIRGILWVVNLTSKGFRVSTVLIHDLTPETWHSGCLLTSVGTKPDITVSSIAVCKPGLASLTLYWRSQIPYRYRLESSHASSTILMIILVQKFICWATYSG